MSSGRFAVYLNANARRVSPKIVTAIEELVHPDDLFYSETKDDAQRHAATILERKYPTVFTGGGDGTVVQFINALNELAHGEKTRLPVLGVLSLGTGNAISSLVSSGNPILDLKAYVTNPSQDISPISLIACEGHLFPFGGLGLDAEILSDYQHMKEKVGTGALKPVFDGVGGYFMSFFGATAPRRIKALVRNETLKLRIVNVGERAFQVGPSGEMTRSFETGETLYDGPAIAMMAGTVPVYGFGMRILPWADRHKDHMHVRVGRFNLFSGLVNLPSIWKGNYQGEGFADFYADRISVACSQTVPFQMAGDSFGLRDQVVFALRQDAVRLLRFL